MVAEKRLVHDGWRRRVRQGLSRNKKFSDMTAGVSGGIGLPIGAKMPGWQCSTNAAPTATALFLHQRRTPVFQPLANPEMANVVFGPDGGVWKNTRQARSDNAHVWLWKGPIHLVYQENARQRQDGQFPQSTASETQPTGATISTVTACALPRGRNRAAAACLQVAPRRRETAL